jgi:YD repeat-containing protein
MTMPDGRIINHTYDANGNLTAVTPPGKSAHNSSFNSINLPSSYTPPTVVGTGHTTYAYDSDRRLSLITRPDGETIKFSYDHAGRLSSLVTPTATLDYGYSATTCNLIGKKINYVIDPQNRRVGKKVNGILTAGFLYDDDRGICRRRRAPLANRQRDWA